MGPGITFPNIKEKESWQEGIEDIFFSNRDTFFNGFSSGPNDFSRAGESESLANDLKARGSKTTKKILLVDDDKLVLITLKRLLTREGYKVTTALSGETALRRIKEADFDLVMSDIKMPRMGGIETVKKIREYLMRNNKKVVPEIFITAYAKEDIYREAMSLNAAGYIQKPFDIKALQQIVKKAIGEKSNDKENFSN